MQPDEFNRTTITLSHRPRHQHLFEITRLQANWQNYCTFHDHAPDYVDFVTAIITTSYTILTNPQSIRSTQPHPAILRWLQHTFHLEQQCDTTPLNSCSGLFAQPPRVSRTLRSLPTAAVETCGHRPATPTAQRLPCSSFISVHVTDNDWLDRLKQAAHSCATSTPRDVVCMLSLTGPTSRQQVYSKISATGGTILFHCPQKTLTVINANGFPENIDPHQRLRGHNDFKQADHKAELPNRPKVSYTLDPSGTIIGPKTGGADQFERHNFCSNTTDIVFILYSSNHKTPDEIYAHVKDKLRTLTTALTLTNPAPPNVHANNCIRWQCGMVVELTVANLLQSWKPIATGLAAFRAVTPSHSQSGTFYETRINLGYTSSQSLMYMRTLGMLIADARSALANIAQKEMQFLRMIEDKGLMHIMDMLSRSGVPIDPTGFLVPSTTCPSCRRQTTTMFRHTHGVPTTSQHRHYDDTADPAIDHACLLCTTKFKVTPDPIHHKKGRFKKTKCSTTEQHDMIITMLQRGHASTLIAQQPPHTPTPRPLRPTDRISRRHTPVITNHPQPPTDTSPPPPPLSNTSSAGPAYPVCPPTPPQPIGDDDYSRQPQHLGTSPTDSSHTTPPHNRRPPPSTQSLPPRRLVPLPTNGKQPLNQPAEIEPDDPGTPPPAHAVHPETSRTPNTTGRFTPGQKRRRKRAKRPPQPPAT